MGDPHPGNIMMGVAGKSTIIDALIAPVPERMWYDVPQNRRAFRDAEATHAPENTADFPL